MYLNHKINTHNHFKTNILYTYIMNIVQVTFVENLGRKNSIQQF